MVNGFDDGGISPDVEEDSFQGQETGKDVEGVHLDVEESFVDSGESMTESQEETASHMGLEVPPPSPPLLDGIQVDGASAANETVLETSAPVPEGKSLGLDSLSDVFDMDDREMLAQEEVRADAYGMDGLSTTDNLLFVGNMFLALILGCIGSSIFSRFFRWYI